MRKKLLKNLKSYLDGIKRALFGELKAVEKYKTIRRVLAIKVYRDILFDIITDEIKHASKYNYLFTLNNNMNELSMNRKAVQDTSKFTPDQWVTYITPLVNRALAEAKEGINPETLISRIYPIRCSCGFRKKSSRGH